MVSKDRFGNVTDQALIYIHLHVELIADLRVYTLAS